MERKTNYAYDYLNCEVLLNLILNGYDVKVKLQIKGGENKENKRNKLFKNSICKQSLKHISIV